MKLFTYFCGSNFRKNLVMICGFDNKKIEQDQQISADVSEKGIYQRKAD